MTKRLFIKQQKSTEIENCPESYKEKGRDACPIGFDLLKKEKIKSRKTTGI
ncbi:hypothetical protein CHCC20488_0128 [Bacillus paralicheniformis]|nr:hypothetical protein CHCC20497_2566 [Bacillus paralicheniformis]TWN39165.1 hypothetical protein CHCC14523_2862 [Bacillus paralicheniformis]TWN88156.1 hypothetical protein CHCC20492_4513 [Bacillus paralicheniformis]TWO03292.1 hypothetical protein CHCC20488_0128 [Bacillus paralicheniformis]